MRTSIKRITAILLLVVLCTSLSLAQAEGSRIIFAEAFAKDCGLSQAAIYEGVGMTVIGDKVYQMMVSGDIYVWDSVEDNYALYAHVPARSWVNVEIPFEKQSESVRRRITSRYDFLLPLQGGKAPMPNR